MYYAANVGCSVKPRNVETTETVLVLSKKTSSRFRSVIFTFKRKKKENIKEAIEFLTTKNLGRYPSKPVVFSLKYSCQISA